MVNPPFSIIDVTVSQTVGAKLVLNELDHLRQHTATVHARAILLFNAAAKTAHDAVLKLDLVRQVLVLIDCL